MVWVWHVVASSFQTPCSHVEAKPTPWADDEVAKFLAGERMTRREGYRGLSARRRHLTSSPSVVWERMHAWQNFHEWLPHCTAVRNTSHSDNSTLLDLDFSIASLLSTTLHQVARSSSAPRPGDDKWRGTLSWHLYPTYSGNDSNSRYLSESKGCWVVEPDGNGTLVSYECDMTLQPTLNTMLASALVHVGMSEEIDIDWLDRSRDVPVQRSSAALAARAVAQAALGSLLPWDASST